jgi:N-acetylmuramoyl-L-alanine amidase
MPTNTLLKRLALLYSQETIRHPQLREVTLAQWMLESRRATSALAKEHYNFGGLKWRPEMKPYATRVSYEAHDGRDWYCKFATIESFINGYWAFIDRSPYTGWEEHINSGEDYIRFIGPIYTPTAGYADKVLRLVPEAKSLLDSSSDGAARPEETGARQTTASLFSSLGTIVLDPGHGGTKKVGNSSPNNAISASGVKEKKLTLDFCLILRDLLEQLAAKKNQQIRVVLTRTGDVNVGIRDRAAVAAEHKAHLFLCLHFNGDRDKSLRGVETFFRAKENGNMNLDDDVDFATAVNTSLFNSLRSIDVKAKNRGVKPDTQTEPKELGVMNDTSLGNQTRPDKCRSCYVELEFISNPAVDRLLISGPEAIQNRQLVMGNLAKTLTDYLEKLG